MILGHWQPRNRLHGYDRDLVRGSTLVRLRHWPAGFLKRFMPVPDAFGPSPRKPGCSVRLYSMIRAAEVELTPEFRDALVGRERWLARVRAAEAKREPAAPERSIATRLARSQVEFWQERARDGWRNRWG